MKKIFILTLMLIVFFVPSYNVMAAKQSKTKNDAFWENYIFYHIIGNGEGEAIAIDKDYAEAKGYCDPDSSGKSKKKVAFTYPATIKHDGKTYKLTRLPDYRSSDYFEKHDLKIIPNKGQSFNYFSLKLNRQIDDGNGWPLNYLNAVTKITIPDTMEYIGTGSLAQCYSLEEVDFAKKYDYLTFGDYIFVSNKLKSIKIPEGTYKLGTMALGIIPDISFPKSLKKIGDYVVSVYTDKISITTGNPKFKITDGILYSKDESVLYSASANVSKNIVISSKVREIRPCAFTKANIKTVTFKNKFISRIPSGAFADCKKLTEVKGLKEIKRIDYAAFAGCSKLKSIGNPKVLYGVSKAAFWDTKKPAIKLYGKAKMNKYAFEKPELGPEE